MADFLIENNFLMATATAGAAQDADPIYEPRAVFSINASNELQGTFWITKNGTLMKNNLGTASYTVRDKTGVAVAGLTQSNIAADLNGLFEITPVSAASILDLTHYTVDITISADDTARDGVVGITVGE